MLWGPAPRLPATSGDLDDVDRGVGHRDESQQGGGAHWAYRGQGGGQALQGLGVDEHPAIGGAGHVDLVSVDTPAVQDVIEDPLCVLDVIMARGEGAGVLIVAAVTREVTGGVTRVIRVEAGVTRQAVKPSRNN